MYLSDGRIFVLVVTGRRNRFRRMRNLSPIYESFEEILNQMGEVEQKMKDQQLVRPVGWIVLQKAVRRGKVAKEVILIGLGIVSSVWDVLGGLVVEEVQRELGDPCKY